MPIIKAFLMPHPPLLVPAVGRGRERELERTAESCRRVAAEIAELEPDTLVIISPHATVYSDYIHVSPGREASGSLRRFGSAEVTRVRYDSELVSALEALCAEDGLPAGTLGGQEPELDHGVLVPLSFINQAYADYRLVRVSPSDLSLEEHYRFGMLLARAAEETHRRVVVVASGDLSHKLAADGPYGFAPEGALLDRQLTAIFASGDFGALFGIDETLREKGAECGFLPVLMLAGALDQKAVRAELLSYEGPFGVGYAVASFTVTGEDGARDFLAQYERQAAKRLTALRAAEDPYVSLARETLESYLRDGISRAVQSDLPDELYSIRAGVFVTLKKRGQLRGCIGTTGPTTGSVAEEIRRNAVSSGTRDPRFPPVTAEELPELVYGVDVLSPAEACDESMLDPAAYGVIVTSGVKRGLLLPGLAGIDTVAEQLAVAKRKAGIRENETCRLERFRVARHT